MFFSYVCNDIHLGPSIRAAAFTKIHNMLSIHLNISVWAFITLATSTILPPQPQPTTPPHFTLSTMNTHLSIAYDLDTTNPLSSPQVYLCTLSAMIRMIHTSDTPSHTPQLITSPLHPNVALQITSNKNPFDAPSPHTLITLALSRLIETVTNPQDRIYAGKYFQFWRGELFALLQYTQLNAEYWANAEIHGLAGAMTGALPTTASVTSKVSFSRSRSDTRLSIAGVLKCLAKTMLDLAMRYVSPDEAAALPISVDLEPDSSVVLEIKDHFQHSWEDGKGPTTLGAMESLFQVANAVVRKDVFSRISWDISDLTGALVATGIIYEKSSASRTATTGLQGNTDSDRLETTATQNMTPLSSDIPPGVEFDLTVHDRHLFLLASIGNDPVPFQLIFRSSSRFTWVNSQRSPEDPGALGILNKNQ